MRIKYLLTDDIRSEDFNELILNKYPHFIQEDNPDIVLVSGGDGAMLHAIQKHNKYKVPFLGRAAGSLNFLMNKFDNDEVIIDNLLSDKFDLHFLKTNSIKVTLKQGIDETLLGQAVNDVVLGSSIMGYHHFIIDSDDNSFTNFELNGSGICVSTDLGSTGYNFNLGSQILPLGSKLWSVSGVVTNRYLKDIIYAQNLVISCLSPTPSSQVFLDGIKLETQLIQGDKLILSIGDKINIAFFDEDDFIKRRVDITSRYRKG